MAERNKIMEKIIEKIQKLLALANNNPNENEAMAAALKAQRLMAENDISLEQVDETIDNKEIVKEIYHASNKHEMKKWKFGLANVVANNFRCKVFFLDGKDVVFYGYQADAKIALQVFTFLYEVGNKLAVRYYNKCKKEGRNTQGVMNTYLIGFKDGVASVLEKQCTALMIVTPQEVTDSFEEMTAGWGTLKTTIRISRDSRAYDTGKQDGRDTANSRSLHD